MKRGSDVGSRQKRSSNAADELNAMPRSCQLTVTSKTCRTPAMNGARKGQRNDPTRGDRLCRLHHAADHQGDARANLRKVDAAFAGLPLPRRGALLTANRDCDLGFGRGDRGGGRGRDGIPTHRRLGGAVPADQQQDFRTRRRDRRWRLEDPDLRSGNVRCIADQRVLGATIASECSRRRQDETQ